jgi:hypothetical protein
MRKIRPRYIRHYVRHSDLGVDADLEDHLLETIARWCQTQI